MGTLLMRQASSFLQEKYKAARLALTDVSEIELLVEKVTDDNPWCPDTKSMTRIAEASYDFDDYWKIVDFLHERLFEVNWKKWRQSYNTLILVEFLIIHGPEDFAMEFKSDVDVIKELGTFSHIDNKGVNWGLHMSSKTKRILELIQGGEPLHEVRSKAIKLTNEIQGFGSSSPSSSSSSPSSLDSWRSSFDSYSTSSSPSSWNSDTTNEVVKPSLHDENHEQDLVKTTSPKLKVFHQHNNSPISFIDVGGVYTSDILDWQTFQETFTEINLNDDCDNHDKRKMGFFQGFCSKHLGYSPLNNNHRKDKNT